MFCAPPFPPRRVLVTSQDLPLLLSGGDAWALKGMQEEGKEGSRMYPTVTY